MSGLWIAIAAVSATAAGVLLLSLAKHRSAQPRRRADFDLVVFKDQLAELERDRERGILSDTEAAAARTEIERRILAIADDVGQAEDGADEPGAARRLSPAALLIGLAAPAAALAMYLHSGTPEAPDAPFAARNIDAERDAVNQQRQAAEMAQLTDKLAKRLAQDPKNLRGWLLLGRSYLAMGRDQDAIGALKRAYELEPLDPAVIVEYGEALILTDQGRVGDLARALMERAREADPRNPRARHYIALAKSQGGDIQGALQDWVDLRAISPADAPWLKVVDEQIASSAKDLGVDPGSVTPTRAARALAASAPASAPPLPGGPPQSAPGPTREDMEAAQQMSADERAQMIRGMMQRLADRLRENPNDPAGWRRLARAYRVLGETAKAAEAEARAKALGQ